METLHYGPLNPKLDLSKPGRPLRSQDEDSACEPQAPPCLLPTGQHPSLNMPMSRSPDPPSPTIDAVTFKSEPPEAAINSRRLVARDLQTCRELIVTLELTRMRKARLGMHYWTLFWKRVYHQDLFRKISKVVSSIFREIDHLFQSTAQKMVSITHRIDERVAQLRSLPEAKAIWYQLERQISRSRKIRKCRTKHLFDDLRVHLENIPIEVPDELFDDLKRGVFALDPSGDYHPGDSTAEEWDQKVDVKVYAGILARQRPDLQVTPWLNEHFQRVLLEETAAYIEQGGDDLEPSTPSSEDSAPRQRVFIH